MRRTVICCTLGALAAALAGCGPQSDRPASKVEAVLNARETGRPLALLTRTFGPFSLDEAYDVQQAVTARLVAAGDEVVGYKVGYASEASQKAWNIPEPAYGPLFASQRVADGGTLDLGDFHAFHIEAEVAFVMGRRVDKPVTSAAAIKPAVRSVHAGFDIPDNRFVQGAERQVPDIVADGVGAFRFALGPGRDPAAVDVEALTGVVEQDGTVVYRGDATSVMGSPWTVLVWLANKLVARGQALEPGDVILTGALDKAYAGPRGELKGRYVGRLAPLPPVTVRVVDTGGCPCTPKGRGGS